MIQGRGGAEFFRGGSLPPRFSIGVGEILQPSLASKIPFSPHQIRPCMQVIVYQSQFFHQIFRQKHVKRESLLACVFELTILRTIIMLCAYNIDL